MTDRFLTEVRRMHAQREVIKSLDDLGRRAMAERLGDGMADSWVFGARDAQLPPPDLDFCWLFLGGRGSGKTHAMSSAVHTAVRAGLGRLIVVAPTINDLHAVNLEGPSGILRTCGTDPVPRWVQSKRRLEWPNGAKATFFSGEEPDGLRGHQGELAVIDELARMRYATPVWDMLNMGLRLGDKPRVLLGTTPRPSPMMKKILKMKGVSITTGSTYDNSKHLSASFIKQIREMYEGTRLGRQELHGAMLLDPVNALFKDDWIMRDPVDESLIEQVTVGVDPSGGNDEVGIVVVAMLNDGRYAILADRTATGSPAHWGEAVIRAHDDFDADDVVVERNFGGDMAIDVIQHAADRAMQAGRANNMIRIHEVHASRGKAMRAEPISLLYEKGRVLHRSGLDNLEAEMMAFSRDWDRVADGSPNRLDAAVWGLTRLSGIVMDIPIA
jgi:phage terminase large subunit-like protein